MSSRPFSSIIQSVTIIDVAEMKGLSFPENEITVEMNDTAVQPPPRHSNRTSSATTMGPSSTTATSSNQGHGHHFVLSNPFSHSNEVEEDSGSHRTNASTPNPPTTPATAGFWNHLVPRHAYFHVKIVVHQLANIPLVSGEYSAQWKFKGVHSLPGAKNNNSGLLSAIVKNKQKANGKRKGKDAETDARKHEHDDTDDTGSLNSSENHHGSVSSVHSSSSSSSSGSPVTPLASSTAASVASWPSSVPSASTIHPPPTTPARGQTQFIKLKDHNVKWEHTLSAVVRMDIDRDPTAPILLSTPFKLAIMQRDSSYRSDRTGTHSTTTTKQFGNVTLDLAQYACKGDVTRQYLLRESKTNATLKLTTTITHIPHTTSAAPTPSTSSAPTPALSAPSASSSLTINPPTPSFVAPPLPSGEILAGISTIRSRGLNLGGEADIYRTRPKGLDLYGPYYDQEELEMDLMGGVRAKGQKFTHVHNLSIGTHGRARSGSGPSFDPSRLPLAYGAKTTEALIDAIFNPVPTRDKRRESPFTIYVPETPPSSAGTPGTGTGTGSEGGMGSIPSSAAVSASSPDIKFPMSRSDSILPGGTAKTSPLPTMKPASKAHPKRPLPSRAQSTGIGAGLGIMGLGMGLGVGLGAQVSITPASPLSPGAESRKSADARPSVESVRSAGRPSLDVPGRGIGEGGRSMTSVEGVKSAGAVQDSGRRWWRPGRSRPSTPVPAA